MNTLDLCVVSVQFCTAPNAQLNYKGRSVTDLTFFLMPKKPKIVLPAKIVLPEMWINPHSNLKHLSHHVWDRRDTDAANARYLELADVALRIKSTLADQFVVPAVIDEE